MARWGPPIMNGRFLALGLLFSLSIAAIPRVGWALDQRIPLRVGRPPASVTLTARSAADGVRLEVRGTGAPVRTTFPAGAEASVETDTRRLANGAVVAVVRVVDGRSRWAAIVSARRGRPLLLWQGRLDLVGDPGERRGAVVEVEDRTGDGAADVIVGTLREDTFVCGQPPAILDPRAVHPETLELRPVVLRRLPELPPPGEREVVPSPDSPGPAERPLVDALHFRRASSVAGLPAGASTAVPGGIGDGDPSTAWVEGAGSGTYEFATAMWAGGSGLPIRAFSIVPRAPGALEASTRMPAAVWLVGDRGPRLRVPLPADARPGQRYWVVPPEPLAWSCVSVVLDAGGGGAGPSHLALAEVEAYSEVDFGGGIPHLLAELAAGAARADRAEALLGQLGRPALEAIVAAFPDMPAIEKMRALRVYARMARTLPAAYEPLGRAVLSPDRDVSVEARRALLALGPVGARTLAAVAADEPTGEALMELAERHPALAVEPVMKAMEARGGVAKPVLRRVLARCGREAPEQTLAAVESRLGGAPDLLAAFAEALAGVPGEARTMGARTLEAAVARAETFEARYRSARAAAALAPGGLPRPVVAFLEGQARTGEEWMMRAEALRALAAAPGARRELSMAALEDPYPRVRLAAIEALAPALASDRASALEVAELARRDAFPFVRAGAIRALGGVDAARPIVEAGLRDRAERVRAAAVEAFTARRDRAAWPRIAERIRDEDEWPVVTDAAIAYARELCIEGAVDVLRVVIERAERPRAWDPDLTSATLATEALAAIGTPEARAVLTAAARRPAQGAGQAAARALQRPRTCGPSSAAPGP